LIHESLEQSRRDFDQFLEDSIQINFDEERQRIYEHWGLAKPKDQGLEGGTGSVGPGTRGAFGRSARRMKGPAGAERSQAGTSFGTSRLSKSVLGGSVSRGPNRASLFTDVAEQTAAFEITSAPEDPYLRSKQEKYAAKVKELNSARLQEVNYSLVEEFARVELEAGGDTPEHLMEAYRALRMITKEKDAIKARQYAKSYLEDNPGKSTALRKQILDGAREYLEDSFYGNVDKLVSTNPREANLGGVPSKINKVRAYLRIRAGRKDLDIENVELQMLGDDYCWALIFYLIRSGLVQEAAQYVAENERAIKSMDRHFTQYMAAFARDPERRLPRDMQSRINAEYQQRLRLAPENSIDPYRMACYKIVGRCDLSRKVLEGINTSLEDWIWLMVSLAREVTRADEAAGEYFGLEDVRSTVEEIGQRHFSSPSENSSAYATFFFLQILVGLFEKAVAWLYPHNYVAAVHFAIALDYYGLLRVADFYTSEEKLRKSSLPKLSALINTISHFHHTRSIADQLRSSFRLLYSRLPHCKSRSRDRLPDPNLPQLRLARQRWTIACLGMPRSTQGARARDKRICPSAWRHTGRWHQNRRSHSATREADQSARSRRFPAYTNNSSRCCCR